jgi:hypothetical protein
MAVVGVGGVWASHLDGIMSPSGKSEAQAESNVSRPTFDNRDSIHFFKIFSLIA